MAITRSLLQVDGVWIPDPSAMSIDLHDVSSEGAGRSEDLTMHKLRLGQFWSISLTWNYTDASVGAEILTAFNPEYFMVSFINPMTNTRDSKQFYRGDPKIGVYNYELAGVRFSSISFDIIQVSPGV